MITQDLVSYIRSERSKGRPDEAIRADLLQNGWKEEDVKEGISASSNPASPALADVEKRTGSYRRKLRWIVFAAWTMVLFAWAFLQVGYPGSSQVFATMAIPIVIASALAAAVSGMGAQPKGALWKEIIDIVVRFIGASAIIVIVGFALFWITCFVILSGGGANF